MAPQHLSLCHRVDHPPCGVTRCGELIAVAVSQIDGDPVVSHRPVNPALEITIAHIEKIIALKNASSLVSGDA
jgi:hypothetical protein